MTGKKTVGKLSRKWENLKVRVVGLIRLREGVVGVHYEYSIEPRDSMVLVT